MHKAEQKCRQLEIKVSDSDKAKNAEEKNRAQMERKRRGTGDAHMTSPLIQLQHQILHLMNQSPREIVTSLTS